MAMSIIIRIGLSRRYSTAWFPRVSCSIQLLLRASLVRRSAAPKSSLCQRLLHQQLLRGLPRGLLCGLPLLRQRLLQNARLQLPGLRENSLQELPHIAPQGLPQKEALGQRQRQRKSRSHRRALQVPSSTSAKESGRPSVLARGLTLARARSSSHERESVRTSARLPVLATAMPTAIREGASKNIPDLSKLPNPKGASS